MSSSADDRYTVALQGFSEFERAALGSFFRLAAQRTPSYVQIDAPDQSDFVIADADHPPAMQAVQSVARQQDTVFVGVAAPPGAMAWLPRPIDPVHIVRELDSLVQQRRPPSDVARAAAIPQRDSGPASRSGASSFGALDSYDACGPEVLIVEDSAVARRFLQVRLQRLGYRVQVANDGEEAMALIEAQPFALVFLDVVLGPEGSLGGLEICRYLKQDQSVAARVRPQVVLVTGLASEADRVRGQLAGCDAYLTKPLHEPDFLATLYRVDPWLNQRR